MARVTEFRIDGGEESLLASASRHVRIRFRATNYVYTKPMSQPRKSEFRSWTLRGDDGLNCWSRLEARLDRLSADQRRTAAAPRTTRRGRPGGRRATLAGGRAVLARLRAW